MGAGLNYVAEGVATAAPYAGYGTAIAAELVGSYAVIKEGVAAFKGKCKAMRKFWDRALLMGVALLLCLTTGGSFLLGELYHINPAWFFFAWGSIFLLPMLWKEFRTYFVRPGFIIFFVIWMIVHGATVVALIRWLPLILWPLLLLFELGIGFAIAGWLFNFPLRRANGRAEQP